MFIRREKIIKEALRIIESEPNGIRINDLCQRVKDKYSDFSINYIRENIMLIPLCKPDEVYRPERGFFLHTKYRNRSMRY